MPLEYSTVCTWYKAVYYVDITYAYGIMKGGPTAK